MRRYSFKPKLVPTLATIILLPCLIALGMWQLHRAEQKRQLLSMYETRLQQAAQPVTTIVPDAADIDFLPVKVTGEYDNHRHILLDNKFYKHLLGYQVLTPFIIKGTGKAILVNRGWIPRGEIRNHLPKIPPVSGTQTVKGYIKIPDKNVFTLGRKYEKTDLWPRRVQQVNIHLLSQQLELDLYPFILLLEPSEAHGFQRDWTPVVVNPAKHTGYAIQWFSLAVLLVIIYISVNLRKENKQNKHEN